MHKTVGKNCIFCLKKNALKMLGLVAFFKKKLINKPPEIAVINVAFYLADGISARVGGAEGTFTLPRAKVHLPAFCSCLLRTFFF